MLLVADPILSKLTVSSRAAIVLVVFLTTCLLPAAVVGLGMKLGRIQDEFINRRSERTVPYLLSLVGYIGCILWLYNMGLSLFYLVPLAGSAISIVVITLINLKWKISAHLSAMGGLSGGIFAYSYLVGLPSISYLVLSILLGGVVGWSRMTLKAHTLGQVCAGWSVGFASVAVTWIAVAA